MIVYYVVSYIVKMSKKELIGERVIISDWERILNSIMVCCKEHPTGHRIEAKDSQTRILVCQWCPVHFQNRASKVLGFHVL